jgi:hypothetical protein
MKNLRVVEMNLKHVKNIYKNVKMHYMKEKSCLKKGLSGRIDLLVIHWIRLFVYLVMKCILK